MLLLLMIAVNAAGPAFVAHTFATARNGPDLEGAYLVGFVIGQPAALLSLTITMLLLGRFWRPQRGRDEMFAACGTLAGAPALAMMAWPQLGFTWELTYGPAVRLFGESRASWLTSLVAGFVVLAGLTFAITLGLRRGWQRVRNMRSARPPIGPH